MQDVGTPNGTRDAIKIPSVASKVYMRPKTKNFSFERLISGNGHVSLREL